MRIFDKGSCFLAAASFVFPLAFPLGARGQTSSAAEKQGEQLTVEKIKNGLAVAPDFRVTRVDGELSQLTGAYGGWLMEDTLLVGAGAYWLTASSGDVEMNYAGAVVEWFARPNHRLDFSLRGLVGGGNGTLPFDVAVLPRGPRFRDFGPPFHSRGFNGGEDDELGGTRRVAVREGFFVAEPQVSMFLKLNRWLRVGVGGGYRLIGGARGLEDRLRGASGSVSLQLGSF